MYKLAILAAASLLALTAGAAAASPQMVMKGARVNPVVHQAKGLKMLYNQNSSSDGINIDSQTYTSGTYTAYNDMGADDFVVPKGKKWKVSEVDVTGCCVGSGGTENVTFYKDASGMPGKAVKGGTFSALNGSGYPNYAIPLTKAVKLKAGHYWVSVQVNCNYLSGCGEWGWTMRSTVSNDAAVWQQPGNGAGTGCTTWTAVGTCFSGDSGDFMFDLQGK